MRIVAGKAKGRRLTVPSRGTRPTSDRAREALFSSLAGIIALEGARVLDLFAGTGAVGLEALSRGAAQVTFVESDRSAVSVLTRNLSAVGLSGGAVWRGSARNYLVSETEQRFQLIFADPPYALPDDELRALLVALVPVLDVGGVVVVERSARGAAPDWPEEIQALKQRRYGEGMLWYGLRR